MLRSVSALMFSIWVPIAQNVVRALIGSKDPLVEHSGRSAAGWIDADVASEEQHGAAGAHLVLGHCRTIMCNCAPWQLFLVLFAFLNKFRMLL